MAKIASIEVIIADVPTVRPHVLAMTTMMSQAVVLVFIRRDDDIIGVGEATTIGGLAYGEESPESIRTNIDAYFAPLLIGQNADQPEMLMTLLAKHIVGNRFAKCAIETALLDGLGQATNVPVSALLGGARHDRLPVAWTLASGDTATDIDEGKLMLAEKRHNMFKLKIGKREVIDDCKHVAAIARAFEGRASIRVDVNQYWSRLQAAQGIAILQDAGVELVEQPLPGHDIVGMAQLCEQFDAAIMADEGLSGPISARRFADARAADVFALKITQSGGLVAAQEVARIANVAKVDLYGGTMLEGGIGTVASAHLFATFDEMKWGTELFGPLLMTEEILEEPLEYSNFSLKLPIGSGLGVKVDRGKLERFARN